MIDSVLAGLARASTGRSQDEVDAVAAYLLTVQNGDGGWPDVGGGPSRNETTAWALQLLAHATRRTEILLAAGTAMSYLGAQHDLDAAYGIPRSPRDVAEEVLALDAWQALPGADAAAAVNDLLSTQLADGSWEASPYDTGVVLRALRILLSPNLAIDPGSVVASPTLATEGEPVRVRARIDNLGHAGATSILVRAFDSDGAPFGPGVVIPALASGESANVALLLDTAGHAGSAQVFVVVDPDGAIEQLTREDDRVAAPLPIGPRPAGADLAVYGHTLASVPDRITRFPAPVTVTATVANLGQTGVTGAEVALLLEGVLLAARSVDLPAASTATVSLDATLPPVATGVALEVAVNRHGTIPETRTDNDTAVLVIPLVPTVDLAIADLRAAPLPVDQGRDLEIQFAVVNSGTADAASARVRGSVLDASGAPIATLPGFAAPVPRGATVQGRLVWRANDLRAASVRVEVAAETRTESSEFRPFRPNDGPSS